MGYIFLYSHMSFTAAYSVKSEKICQLILLNREAASLTVARLQNHILKATTTT